MTATFSEFVMEPSPGKTKRFKRNTNACDICRKRKIRCKGYGSLDLCSNNLGIIGDSAESPDQICTHCREYDLQCTHTGPIKKPGPKKRYVEILKQRVNELEKERQKAPEIRPVDPSSSNIPSPDYGVLATPSPPNATTSAEDADFDHAELTEQFKDLNVASLTSRYFGSSSTFMLVKNAISVKRGIEGHVPQPILAKRPEFWKSNPWEKELAKRETPRYTFPDSDLMFSLIDIYFTLLNPYCPLLHRPTFLEDVKKNLHIIDHHFGGLVLAVCALASTFTSDPRVFYFGDDGKPAQLSAGFKYFAQIQLIQKSVHGCPSIHDLQTYCLLALYYMTTSMPQGSYNVLGLGLRCAEEIGLHRKKQEGTVHTIDQELKRRAFFCLLSLDRLTCSFIGRSCYMHEETFDVDLPTECDDEYWDTPDPDQCFKQPAGKPSHAAFFLRHIKLLDILALTLRTLYSNTKSKSALGLLGDESEHRIVALLDSRMNAWLDALPSYLRLDSGHTDPVFQQQALILRVVYHHVAIQIHRPFIFKQSSISLPSLAICVNAAKSAARVLDDFKVCTTPVPVVQGAFSAAVILTLNMWRQKRSGKSVDTSKDAADVQKCLRFLKRYEDKWQVCGRLHDLLDLVVASGAEDNNPQGIYPMPGFPPQPSWAKVTLCDNNPGEWQDGLSLRYETLKTASVQPPIPATGNMQQEPALSSACFSSLGLPDQESTVAWTMMPDTSIPGFFDAAAFTDTSDAPMDINEDLFNAWMSGPAGFNPADWSALSSIQS